MGWETVARPGQFGKERDARHREYDARYGVGRWRLVWHGGEVTALYEDAYFAYLSERSDLLERLLADARDVYDDAESNVDSGLDYTRQETAQTHLQDIAIRRCLVRLGRTFRGQDLVQIRSSSSHPVGAALSPTNVPFHRPELILQPAVPGWWTPGSVEDFYQSNKVLQTLVG